MNKTAETCKAIIIVMLLVLQAFIVTANANALDSDFAGLSEAEIAFIKKLKLIRVPVVANQPPLSFVENKSKAGYLNDLFVLVAEKLGIKVQFVHGLSYVETLGALENKQVDLLNDYSSYGSNRDFVLQTRAVHVSPFVAVGKRFADKVSAISDLVGKRIVMVNGFQQTRTIQHRYPELTLVLVNSIDEAYQLLRSSEADIYIDNATHAGFILINTWFLTWP